MICKGKHQFIVLASHSLSSIKAEQRVMDVISSYGLKKSPKQLKAGGNCITVTDRNGERKSVSFSELAKGAEKDGAVPHLDRLRWRDTSPHGSVSVSTDASSFPPIVLGLGIRTSEPLEAPGYITNDVVADTLEDILHHRQETARLSCSDSQFRPCFRAYRSYLSSCVTAIDAHLNYQAWFAINDKQQAIKYTKKELKTLKNKYMSIEKKISLWMPLLYSGQTLDLNGIEWRAFDQIKAARNSFIHVNEPDYNFSLQRVTKTLNKCTQGVGQFLIKLCSFAKLNPHPNMIRTRYAPKAMFHKK